MQSQWNINFIYVRITDVFNGRMWDPQYTTNKSLLNKINDIITSGFQYISVHFQYSSIMILALKYCVFMQIKLSAYFLKRILIFL